METELALQTENKQLKQQQKPNPNTLGNMP